MPVSRLSNQRSTVRRADDDTSHKTTGLWAAMSPLLDGRGGLYLEDCDVARVSAPDTAMDDGGVREHAISPGAAARLWGLSVTATGATPINR